MKIQYISYLLPILILVFHSRSASQSPPLIDSLVVEAKEKFDSGDEIKALELYEEVLESNPENFEALWNLSILYAKAGYRLEEESDQRRKYKKAIDLAEKAVELYPDEGYSYYAYAVATGRMTELLGTRDRIRAAHKIRDNVEKAAAMIPEYAPVWHLWGVWHSDVANISAAERTAARFISSGLPDASNEKAEEYLKKAIELDERYILFRLDLARHYVKVGEGDKAKDILEDLVEMKPKTMDDPGHIEEARHMLDELK